ncbi:MAG: EamA family transporter [Candidatus Eisenbacteria bacterium]|uniref:EamA family transporter n=1 Tax=Eiseniibacteriota bacterium TaxID=2212470 RepID=A0A933W981_UNCEI|nr:EamA family transporter [Candidatus Eisenbacteria bacterium]
MSDTPNAAPRASTLAGLAAFSGIVLIWGSTFLVIRIGNDSLSPVWAATLRLSAASAILLAIALLTKQPWPKGRALEAAVWFGVVDFGVSLPLLYWGEMSVPSSIAAIFYASIPLTTALLARAMGLERIRPLGLLGAIIGLGGVIVLFAAELRGAMPLVPLGAVLLGALTAALAGVLLKRGTPSSPITTNAVAHAAGIPFCLVASFALRETHALPATASGWFSLTYLTLVGSIGAFVLFAWLVQRWRVTATSFLAVLTPVLGAFLGATVRHERLATTTIVGAVVVVSGVIIANVADRALHKTR